MVQYSIAGLLVITLVGCSDAVTERPNMSLTEEAFVAEYRSVAKKHMIPYTPTTMTTHTGMLVGEIPPGWREVSRAYGTFSNGLDFVVAGEESGNLAWDVTLITPPDAAYGTEKLHADECSIPFDTPVNSENADAWAAYGKCVLDLVRECGTVFSHIDENNNWITNCADPNG